MGIAFRYVSRELLAVFLVTALVLLVIALGGRFMGYLQDAALGKHSADALLKIMALRVPEFLQLTLPFSFYIALVLTAARLYADQEMTVLVTSGSSPAAGDAYGSASARSSSPSSWHFCRCRQRRAPTGCSNDICSRSASSGSSRR